MISWIIKISCLCYLPQPSASADNTDLGFDNSWYHAQPHPIFIVRHYNRQLSNEVFLISRIIKVEVGVISLCQSRRLRLTTITEALTILDIAKTESKNCFFYSLNEKINESHVFSSSLMTSNTKHANLTWLHLEIMHRGHTSHIIVYIITKWMHAHWLVNQLCVIVPVNPRKNRASSELLYKSNKPQVSMGYGLKNHLGCW